MHKEIATAERHDAAGQHHAAIDALARAAQSGDVEALTRLGKRLLTGNKAPLLPQEGTRFIQDAAAAGGAEANERLAVLCALSRPTLEGWQSALSLLARSAEAGWREAREQLLVFSTDAGAAGRAVTEMDRAPQPRSRATFRSSIWRELASGIDLNNFLTAIPPVRLHEAAPIAVYPGLLPASFCEWAIRRARPKLNRAKIYDATSARTTANDSRTNTSANFDLGATDLVLIGVQTRIAFATGSPPQHLEAISILHYAPGEQFTDHFDFVDPRSPGYGVEMQNGGQRIATFLIYLNEGFEGGETSFPHFGFAYAGLRGEGLCFLNTTPEGNPNQQMLHSGLPPVNQDKWVVSQFIRKGPCVRLPTLQVSLGTSKGDLS
jgi:prolyl 4-hydroxylase